MPASQDRFGKPDCHLEQGWTLEYLMPPSRLYGANGLRTGADGRIYIAQVSGSCVSVIDPDTGVIEPVDLGGSSALGADDLVFDEAGNLYITEFCGNSVSVRSPNGATRVLLGDVPSSNPITYHQGHLIVGECRPDARIMELDRNGGAPRMILENVPMANAFEFGPDGKLYFPVMGTNEIWRVNLDGTGCEVVAGDLGVPDSVKFDSKGRIISTQVGSGQVLRIDPRTGEREVLADLAPGLDNCTFVGDRLFVSHMAGSIHEITAPGQHRELTGKGLLWPLGVAARSDGALYVADGSFAYASAPGGKLELAGMMFTPGYPEWHRGVAAAGSGEWIVTTSVGDVKRYVPAEQHSEVLAQGYDRLMGVARTAGGGVVFAEYGAGRVHLLEGGKVSVLASGLDGPSGVAIAPDGTCFVSEANGGRVVKLSGGRSETVIDGLRQPEGLAVHDGKVYVVDVLARELVEADANGANRRVVASGLPVGSPDGPRRLLGPAGPFTGPLLSFAGLAAMPDGTLVLGADGNGSVMALHPAA